MASHVLSLIDGDTVLDFGSGAGLYGFLLKFAWGRTEANKPFKQVDALDSSPQTVAGLKKMGIYDNVFKSESLKLPFPDNSYDTVICLECLEHLYLEDVPVLMAELLRVCKNKLILSTPPGHLICNAPWCASELTRIGSMEFMDADTFFDKLGELHKSYIDPVVFLQNGFKSFLKEDKGNISVDVIADTHIYVLKKPNFKNKPLNPTVGVNRRTFEIIEGKNYLEDYRTAVKDQLSLDALIHDLRKKNESQAKVQ